MLHTQFPKLDLHLHLDGSVPPETLFQLAKEQGVPVPGETLAGYLEYIRRCAQCGSVNEYLKMFDLPVAVMQDGNSLTRVTRELICLLYRQNLAYAEIRFAPQLHTRKGLSQAGAVEAVLAGREQGLKECPGFDVGILCCMMCIGPETANWKENAETVEVTRAYLDRGVVGLDLAGAEGIVPLKNFAPLFQRAAELGIPCTCHAGDSQGPDTVRDAMDFGARRIGHGHHIYDDPELVRRAIREGITIEVCPTSNIQCMTQPSYGQHPAKKLLDMGLNVTVNTDNMTFAGVDLEAEYGHCLGEMGFTPEDLVKMSENSIRAAFLSEEKRLALLSLLDQKQ
ncbi:MAG: adenosine deaminase [Clostridiales bacterium]|nr:adenosine deaminase [Clostridiales bacterium]